jgi:hypothetical protein
MICPECGREVKLVCRDCQRDRARRGMLQHQRRFLQTWLVGEIELRIREHEGATHLELFDDRWHAFCGVSMFEHPEARRRVGELPSELCSGCRLMFDELVTKAKEAMV